MGSVGWIGTSFLMTRAKVTVTWDVYHRQSNDWLLAVGQSNLTSVRNVFKSVAKLHRGAFQSDATFDELRECAKRLSSLHTSGCPLWDILADDITAELELLPFHRPATEEEEHRAWDVASASLCSQPLGPELKSQRWWCFEYISRQMCGRRRQLQLLLLYVGVLRKWWSQGRSPLLRQAVAADTEGLVGVA
eukprot:6464728-Amphidinium_carterae.2